MPNALSTSMSGRAALAWGSSRRSASRERGVERHGLGVERPQAHRLARGRDGGIEPPPASLHVGELQVHLRHVRAPADGLLARRDRRFHLARAIERDHVLDAGVERDEVLGIVLRGVAFLPRRAAAGDVAESAQALQGGLVLLHPGVDSHLAHSQPGEASTQAFELLRPRGREVPPLAGVDSEVVDLRERQVDVLQAAVDDPTKRGPAAVERRAQRLEVALGRRVLAPGDERQEASPRQVRGRLESQEVENGRDDVDVPNGGADDSRAQEPRRAKDEGHAQGRVVGEGAVRRLAVLAERLAVVGGEDDEHSPTGARREKRLEERPQGGIRSRHLALVGLAGEARGERGRRLVREVRLVQVDEGEPPLAADRFDPPQRRAHRFGARPLGHREGGRLRSPQAVVVDVEAPVETEARIERERAHEGPGAPAPLAEDRGERGPVGREPEARVVVDAVAQGVLAGEQVRVGGQGHDVVRPGRLEPDTLGSEAVDPRRPRVAPAVTAERVRAEGVDGDDQDAELRIAPRSRGAQGAPGECGEAGDGGDRREAGDEASPAPAPPMRHVASTQEILRLCFDSDTAPFPAVVRQRDRPWN
jgi:hypothetical protein